MLLGIEGLAQGLDAEMPNLPRHCSSCFWVACMPSARGVSGLLRRQGLQTHLHAVGDRQQLPGEALGAVPVGILDIAGGATPHVLQFGHRAQTLVIQFDQFPLELFARSG